MRETKKQSRLLKHQQREKQLLAELKNVQHNIEQIRASGGLKITDHATVRYLERVNKMDVTQVHAQIITPMLLELYKKLGDGTYPNGNGLRCVVKDGVVVTILN